MVYLTRSSKRTIHISISIRRLIREPNTFKFVSISRTFSAMSPLKTYPLQTRNEVALPNLHCVKRRSAGEPVARFTAVAVSYLSALLFWRRGLQLDLTSRRHQQRHCVASKPTFFNLLQSVLFESIAPRVSHPRTTPLMGGVAPHIAEQSWRWRDEISEREVVRSSQSDNCRPIRRSNARVDFRAIH